MAPTGGGNYRVATRFARYQNVPEMLRMLARVRRRQDRRGPRSARPAVRRAGRRAARAATVADPSQPRDAQLRRASSAARAEQVRARAVLPEEDNMLKITGDGRKAALDMRLATGQPASRPVQARHRRRADRGDLARAPRPALQRPRHRRALPHPGRAADRLLRPLNTPSGERWNAYDELRAHLGASACPATGPLHPRGPQRRREGPAVRRLPRRARRGAGRLDREDGRRHQHPSRGRRPAPLGLSVAAERSRTTRRPRFCARATRTRRSQIYRYVTEGSFDAYSWQTVERKARFINQVMRGRLDVAGDRGHRRERALVRRGQSTRLRRPADPRQSPRRRRGRPA